MMNQEKNDSIQCSIHNCVHHAENVDYCTLDRIHVGTHESEHGFYGCFLFFYDHYRLSASIICRIERPLIVSNSLQIEPFIVDFLPAGTHPAIGLEVIPPDLSVRVPDFLPAMRILVFCDTIIPGGSNLFPVRLKCLSIIRRSAETSDTIVR